MNGIQPWFPKIEGQNTVLSGGRGNKVLLLTVVAELMLCVNPSVETPMSWCDWLMSSPDSPMEQLAVAGRHYCVVPIISTLSSLHPASLALRK